ncbi:threonine--tRNA ligase [Patescibacteria group bacterium]|nr:threonine--tRNA ligase [Patescibacteria group bacterium]MBU1672888.1 threonine--tRNA ligase [Patescibacteria group bacterium]MBU1963139.1 threonine--tRNA ligase [Patescibacteria group bacterium]
MKDNNEKQLEKIRHSLSHVMADAVLKQFPEAKLGIGPTIENGFYYDFELDRPLVPQDLKKIEKQMKKSIARNIEFKKEEATITDALKKVKGQPYKKELIEGLKKDGEKKVTFYASGEFIDLCAGPHVRSSKEIPFKAFKLTKIAGAYWRGDEKNKMLQRIYGVGFENKEQLDDYLEKIEEAEKRDHRKIGKELDLFSFHPEAPGMVFIHPKGMTIWEEIIKYWRQVHHGAGYKEIRTPQILTSELWKISGHLDNYKENMYFTEVEGQTWGIKPMNCPGGLLFYKEKSHSYREFPLRIAELGLVHRHEKSGVLAGLFRVRQFTQDDAHIYLEPSQLKAELKSMFKLYKEIYEVFELEYHVELSTRPKKFIGEKLAWEKMEKQMEEVLKELKVDYKINAGDGAFYGPKIDFHNADALGRTWQTGTIQVDFNLTERFDIEYINKKGKKERPLMIHRTVLGGIERFLGILIENYAGDFPLWLAPVHISIASVGSDHNKFCEKLAKEFEADGLRVELQLENETVGNKIRLAEKQKIPYMLVIGDKEMESKDLHVRIRGKKEVVKMSKAKFIKRLKDEIGSKSSKLA